MLGQERDEIALDELGKFVEPEADRVGMTESRQGAERRRLGDAVPGVSGEFAGGGQVLLGGWAITQRRGHPPSGLQELGGIEPVRRTPGDVGVGNERMFRLVGFAERGEGNGQAGRRRDLEAVPAERLEQGHRFPGPFGGDRHVTPPDGDPGQQEGEDGLGLFRPVGDGRLVLALRQLNGSLETARERLGF